VPLTCGGEIARERSRLNNAGVNAAELSELQFRAAGDLTAAR